MNPEKQFENRANLPDKLLKPYNPAETEGAIYKTWEESGFFNPDVCVERGVTKSDAETFSIVLPPPNVTGSLHLGHALEHSLQDTVVRFKRMQGKKTLWVPGTDHAAIATQSRFEKDFYKETGKSRHDFSRDEFFKLVHEFGLQNQQRMRQQMRLFGSSLDWSREAFTLDEKRSLAVRIAFKKLYDNGLIYRGNRIVNWDPKGQTTIADDEIVYEERKAKLYTFKYSAAFPISISTTRPETKVGDVAVAVHPDDARYQKFIGQTFEVADFCGVPLTIKIIADKEVDPAFGTGALGVTPAHSMTDWEIAERHGLPKIQVINEYAKMTVGNETILGKKTTDAREAVVAWLHEQNLLEKEEDMNQNISTAERTGGIVEPLPKLQWFINVNKEIPGKGKTLKDLMREPIIKNEIKIIPNHFNKTYFNWIDNLRDWCISRQIIYGHQIPVWYKTPSDGTKEHCGINPPYGDGWIQDQDTLDTWFSSSLWTFSTLGWPEKTQDLANYHPTSLINPGYEIIFFWVARMIMMSEYLLDTVPFQNVYLHGIVRDSKGIKFSKSLKNGIAPEEIITQYGTDALRMSMIVGIGPGNDLNFDINKVKAYSKFSNKIWNATRFVLEQIYDLDFDEAPQLDEEDQKSADDLNALIKEITSEMEDYKFYIVSEKLYHYFWHVFADVIIERSKKKIAAGASDETGSQAAEISSSARSAKWLLHLQLTTLIKALHPFMPFITEEIWSILPHTNLDAEKKLLIIESWPE